MSGIDAVRELAELIRNNPDQASLTGGLPEADIARAEAELGVRFPPAPLVVEYDGMTGQFPWTAPNPTPPASTRLSPGILVRTRAAARNGSTATSAPTRRAVAGRDWNNNGPHPG